MTDGDLVRMCVELEHHRDVIGEHADKAKLVEGDIIAELERRGLTFINYARRRRACVEQQAKRVIPLAAFKAALISQGIPGERAAEACTLEVRIKGARTLLGKEVADRLCQTKLSAAHVKIHALEA